MGDEKKSSVLSGWIKAGLASLFSLVSGAVLMYVSPLVNSAIKPSKPVANFAFQADGLAVTFNNRSSGGSEGWWDFGDGTALEPYVASQQSIQHAYARPGIYSVKLNLRNFVGDENERSVSVPVDVQASDPPAIEEFQVVRLNSDNSAPAVFRLVGKVKNADLTLWALGDDRPLEVNTLPAQNVDRLVTIKEAGFYTLRLVAVKGKLTAEKSESVWVAMPEQGAPGATLQVAYDAVEVRKEEKLHNIAVKYPVKTPDNIYKFVEERSAEPGFRILKAELMKGPSNMQARNLKLELVADNSKVRVTGELIKSPNLMTWSAQIKLTQELQSNPIRRNMEPIPVVLKVPGSTVVPVPLLPRNWEARQKSLNLELRDGAKVVWHGTQLPVNQPVQFKNRPCRLTATETGDQIRLDVVELSSTPAGQAVSHP